MDDCIIQFLPIWRDVARSTSNIYWGSTSSPMPRSWMSRQTHSRMGGCRSTIVSSFGGIMASNASRWGD